MIEITLTEAQKKANDAALSRIYDLCCDIELQIQKVKQNGLPEHARKMERALHEIESQVDDAALEVDPAD